MTTRSTSLMLVLLLALPAQAYIDPGAGSLLLQLIIGGVTAAFLSLKLFWGRFRGRSKKPSKPAQDE